MLKTIFAAALFLTPVCANAYDLKSCAFTYKKMYAIGEAVARNEPAASFLHFEDKDAQALISALNAVRNGPPLTGTHFMVLIRSNEVKVLVTTDTCTVAMDMGTLKQWRALQVKALGAGA